MNLKIIIATIFVILTIFVFRINGNDFLNDVSIELVGFCVEVVVLAIWVPKMIRVEQANNIIKEINQKIDQEYNNDRIFYDDILSAIMLDSKGSDYIYLNKKAICNIKFDYKMHKGLRAFVISDKNGSANFKNCEFSGKSINQFKKLNKEERIELQNCKIRSDDHSRLYASRLNFGGSTEVVNTPKPPDEAASIIGNLQSANLSYSHFTNTSFVQSKNIAKSNLTSAKFTRCRFAPQDLVELKRLGFSSSSENPQEIERKTKERESLRLIIVNKVMRCFQ